MNQPSTSPPPRSALSIERFQQLVEAYGAEPRRWPTDERAAALALLVCSDEARHICEEARALDALLDALPGQEASPALHARILAMAPVATAAPATTRGRVVALRPRLIPRVAAAFPFAAAAALALWLVWPAHTPPAEQIAIEDLGRYAAPSDVLLDGPLWDVGSTVPGMGCDEAGLGCLEGDTEPQLDSLNTDSGRSLV